MNDTAPTATRSLALAEVRASVRAHGFTAADVFPAAGTGGLVDLDAIKAAGTNSEAESQRLLAAHRQQDNGDVHRDE